LNIHGIDLKLFFSKLHFLLGFVIMISNYSADYLEKKYRARNDWEKQPKENTS